MNLNDATIELVRLRDHIATRPPSPKGKQVFEAIQTVLREIERLHNTVKRLNGPFSGEQGLCSFTLATVIGWFEAAEAKGK